LQNSALASDKRECLRCNPDPNPEHSDTKEASGTAGQRERPSVEALESLLADSSKDFRLRWRAARALGEIGEEKSIGILSEALGDNNLAVRLEAAAAIGKIGGPAAAKILQEALDDDSYRIRSRAAKALIQLSGVPSPSSANICLLIKLLSAQDQQVMDALERIGMPAYSMLTDALDSNSFLVRRDISVALALLLRGLLDDRPQKETIHRTLARNRLFPQSLSRLYDLRVIKENGLVKRVETTNFEMVSEKLRGKDTIRLARPDDLPDLRDPAAPAAVSANLDSLMPEASFDQLEVRGRTLILQEDDEHLAVKLSVKPGDERRLWKEATLQSYLQEHGNELGLSSRLAQPVRADRNGCYLFRLQGLPSSILSKLCLAGDPTAICYRAPGDYFAYLNHPALTPIQIVPAFRRCAGDLALLVRAGIVHTSLIPLFHNREQVEIRSDRGIYIWHSKIAGRLDRWRESCLYPNLRLSGIADLEHMEIHGSLPAKDLQHHIGDHLFSLALVLGSYFRERGEFDLQACSVALRDCFAEYHSKLAGTPSPLDEHIDWDRLAFRMSEEMMGDRYMKAVIRGGQCCQDMEISSGPHLGMFNGPFPIPELIRAVHIASLFGVLETLTNRD
jgi:hypothetical protein